MPRLITLTTDFGMTDPYVAEMKGVILGINPNVNIVDLSHEIEKFNIRMAAYTLASASPYFPQGTIHVAVVDPGVGTKRRPLLIQTQKAFYIGPDNGLLTLAAREQQVKHVFQIANPKLMLPEISNTFHGRDIFAPAAAHLAKGIGPDEFGPEIRKIFTAKFARVARGKNTLIGEVLHTDRFGNIITNILAEDLHSIGAESSIYVRLKTRRLWLKLCKSYAEVKKKGALAIVGSHGFIEISVNQGDAASNLGAKTGDKITLSKLVEKRAGL
jgi:S-adenosylmethionine hydrolase